MNLTLPVVTLAALADSINPCAISVLLLTLTFLISLNKSSRQITFTAGVYILGIFITYILIGLGVLRALNLFSFPHILSKIGAVILAVFAILDLAGHHQGLPTFIKPRLAALLHRSTLPAMFGLGVLVGLFEFPCTGGPYLFILGLLHDRATFLTGAAYLLYYNLIFVSPLVIILVISKNSLVVDRVQNFRQAHSRRFAIISSLVQLTLAGVIFVL